MEQENTAFFESDLLKEWFQREKRSFPWRENPTPYHVWVSEIMLQQTQASVVVPYFKRWMAKFPTISHLAHASKEEVMKAWEGLGYYARARYLHEGAQYLVDKHQGEMPDTLEELSQVKGLGPYTLGAILSFAFHKRAAAVDGNVLRVLSRYFLIEEPIDASATQKRIRALAEAILPEEEPWVITEGLIELGAQVCKRTPECAVCPLKGSCLGRLHRRAEALPLKKARPLTIPLSRAVAVICHEGFFLIGQVREKKVMAGLYEFPYLERGKKKSFEKWLGVEIYLVRELSKVTHTFTRYRADLYPSVWKAAEKKEVNGYSWIPMKEALSLPFSSGHRKILQEVVRFENIAY